MSLRTEFESYLEKYYPRSSLSAEMLEIEFHPKLKVNLYPSIHQNFEEELEFCVRTFKFTFPDPSQVITVFLSGWGNEITAAVLHCFKNHDNFATWIIKEEYTNEPCVKQLLKLHVNEIDHQNVLRTTLNSEINKDPQSNVRIYFFNQITHEVFFYWDTLLQVGSRDDQIFKT